MKLNKLILLFFLFTPRQIFAGEFIPVYLQLNTPEIPYEPNVIMRPFVSLSGNGEVLSGSFSLSGVSSHKAVDGFSLSRNGDFNLISYGGFFAGEERISGMSYDGSMVSGYRIDTSYFGDERYESFLWRKDEGFDPNYSGVRSAEIIYSDLSADGGTIVTSPESDYSVNSAESKTAYRLSVGSKQEKLDGVSGVICCAPVKTSADGARVVGAYRFDGSREAVLWNNGEVQRLGFLAGSETSRAIDISADGEVIAGYSGSDLFLWTESGGMENIGLPGGAWSGDIRGISGDGSTLLLSSTYLNGSVTDTIWTRESGFRSVKELLVEQGLTELDEWMLDVYAISDYGNWIAGTAASPNDMVVAYFANIDPTVVTTEFQPLNMSVDYLLPVPEASTVLLYLSGVVLLGLRRVKVKKIEF